MFVLRTAAPASAFAKYGSPPLKPFQPSHSMPAPASAMMKLFGSKSSRSSSRSRTDDRRRDEARNAGRQMDDVTAGVVDGAHLREPTAAPEHERADRVHDRAPQRNEEHPCFEVHAPEHRAGDQNRRDRGEHELEVDHRRARETQRRETAAGQRDVRLPDLVCGRQRGMRDADASPRGSRPERSRTAPKDML